MSRIIAFGWILGIASIGANADHWISVGSFKNRDMAEQGLVQAQAKTAETLSVVASDGKTGINYRISAGPYATRAEASRVLPILAQAGLSGAWIWRMQGYASAATSIPAPTPRSTTPPRGNSALDSFEFPELDEAVFTRETRAAESMRAQAKPSMSEEISERAPPGYQLHRLRRD